MSGKPAARQGDMTQYGGSIVQGSAGVRIGAPHRRGLFGVPRRGDVPAIRSIRCWVQRSFPVKPTSPCPARCRSFSPAPTAVTGQKRPRRWGSLGPGWKNACGYPLTAAR